MRRIDEIVVHCTATVPDWMANKPTTAKVAEVRAWHIKDRDWKDIGYHFLIDRDGTVAKGRPLGQVGAHVQGHNTGTIGVSLIGGFGSSADDAFEDNFTPEQDEALRGLIERLEHEYPTITKVTGHNAYAAKACPGFRVDKWLGTAPPERTSLLQSTTVQASAVQLATGVGAAASGVAALDGTAQLVALAVAGVVILAAAWIMRERIKKWANGVR